MPTQKAKSFAQKVKQKLQKEKEAGEKPKVAIEWTGSCGGCDSAIVGIGEKLLEVGDQVELVLWPVATDFKYKDLDDLDENEIDLTLFNGAIRQEEHREMAEQLREKSEVMVAFGACAHMGGITSFADIKGTEAVLDTKYEEVKTIESGERPKKVIEKENGTLTMPMLNEEVHPLSHEVEVDYIMPGCPPSREKIENFLLNVLEGDLPPRGSVVAGEKNLCSECDRERGDRSIKTFNRPHEKEVDPDKCLLDQGIMCMGPVTRSGCGTRCVDVGVPCRGCYGPTNAEDVGAKFASAIGSVIEPEDEEEIEETVENVKDFTGFTHYFSFGSTPLKEHFMKVRERERGDSRE
ncbi:MAG: NADH:ubiquinone oxidoreductase [Candidatus Nanohaloarchaea archaeon]